MRARLSCFDLKGRGAGAALVQNIIRVQRSPEPGMMKGWWQRELSAEPRGRPCAVGERRCEAVLVGTKTWLLDGGCKEGRYRCYREDKAAAKQREEGASGHGT
jgi:hypothetical protein